MCAPIAFLSDDISVLSCHSWIIINYLKSLRPCSLKDKSKAYRRTISYMVCRNRTPSEFISYGLYLCFSGLPLRRASERLSCFVKRNHVSIWGLDSETPSSKDINKKKKDLRVCCG